MFTPQRHPLNHSVSSNPQFGELLVVKDQAIVMQELSHPGSTTLWGILSSGAPTDYDMYILAPDSERWTNDFYLTNNFWSYLLSSGSGRMDTENVFHPNETFGQFHFRINSEERIPYGNSIRYLRLTPLAYYDEIASAASDLGLTAEVNRWSDLYGEFIREADELLTIDRERALQMKDPVRASRPFEYLVARPIFRRLLERGFSIPDLQR